MKVPIDSAAESVTGIFAKVLSYISSFFDKIGLTSWLQSQRSDIVMISAYFVAFFSASFLLKKYIKYLVFSIIFTIVTINLLEYYKIIDVDWEAFNVLCGFEPNATAYAMFSSVMEWIKGHLVLFGASLVGFILGYKLR